MPPISKGLEFRHVAKIFGDTSLFRDISFHINRGEFFVILGPSGCGKTTLLRLIAGLDVIDGGEVRLNGRVVQALPASERGVAMVFQDFALYPHMTVRDNLAFGLQNLKLPAAEIAQRISQIADMLSLSDLLDRRPTTLSGGQKQRVALARALVKQPELLLMDEPLSSLDPALRLKTRRELARLSQTLAATVVMVTHDQVEAMTLAHRIMVLHDHEIQQIGTPLEIFTRPANLFVARFIGATPMNLLEGEMRRGKTGLAEVIIAAKAVVPTHIPFEILPIHQSWRVGLRAEHVTVSAPRKPAILAHVDFIERLGEHSFVHARLENGREIVAEAPGLSPLQPGDAVGLKLDGAHAHLFDKDGLAYHSPVVAR
jgi:multiple sugar transport system ATP-binding protein